MDDLPSGALRVQAATGAGRCCKPPLLRPAPAWTSTSWACCGAGPTYLLQKKTRVHSGWCAAHADTPTSTGMGACCVADPKKPPAVLGIPSAAPTTPAAAPPSPELSPRTRPTPLDGLLSPSLSVLLLPAPALASAAEAREAVASKAGTGSAPPSPLAPPACKARWTCGASKGRARAGYERGRGCSNMQAALIREHSPAAAIPHQQAGAGTAAAQRASLAPPPLGAARSAGGAAGCCGSARRSSWRSSGPPARACGVAVVPWCCGAG